MKHAIKTRIATGEPKQRGIVISWQERCDILDSDTRKDEVIRDMRARLKVVNDTLNPWGYHTRQELGAMRDASDLRAKKWRKP